MASEFSRPLPFAVFLVALTAAATVLAGGVPRPAPADSASSICGADVVNLVVQCREYTAIAGPKREPSRSCCDALKDADVVCLCRSVPPELLKGISMEKALYVAKCCGKSVPRGIKCGGSLPWA